MKKFNRWFAVIGTLTTFYLSLLVATEPCVGTHNRQVENLQNLLIAMPNEDKQDLEDLFRLLMADGDFAYTLFGDKPVAFTDFFIDVEKFGFFLNRSSLISFSAVYRGRLAWEKYKLLFSSSSFNLMTYVSQDYNFIGFVLFHKQKVKDLYVKHQPLMKEVFKDVDCISPLICGTAVGNMKFISDKNLYHEAIGLLLGYDKPNTQRFRERYDLIDALMIGPFALEGLNSKNADAVLKRLDEKLVNLGRFDSKTLRVADIIQLLNNQSDTTAVSMTLRDETLSPMRIPQYGAIEGELEVVERQEAYDTVRGRIAEILFSENFLEIVLTRLQS